MFGDSELSRPGVLKFCAPYDGVLISEEIPPSLADYNAPYEVLEGCVHEYPRQERDDRHDVSHIYHRYKLRMRNGVKACL